MALELNFVSARTNKRHHHQYEEALEMQTKSLEIRTRIYGGDNHPDVARSFNNIGIVYDKKGDLENALVQHQKALEIRTRVFGSDHRMWPTQSIIWLYYTRSVRRQT